jgi:hypothetical protein
LSSDAQVLQVEQRQPVVVGELEGDVEHAFLGVGHVHQPRQQQRPHLRDRGADAVALFAEQVPEDDRKFLELVGIEPDRLGPLFKKVLASPIAAMPDRSPLTSAQNTGTPALEKLSARICSVTVLPVPVAPVIKTVAVGIFQIEIFTLVDAVVGVAAGADVKLAFFEHVVLVLRRS